MISFAELSLSSWKRRIIHDHVLLLLGVEGCRIGDEVEAMLVQIEEVAHRLANILGSLLLTFNFAQGFVKGFLLLR